MAPGSRGRSAPLASTARRNRKSSGAVLCSPSIGCRARPSALRPAPAVGPAGPKGRGKHGGNLGIPRRSVTGTDDGETRATGKYALMSQNVHPSKIPYINVFLLQAYRSFGGQVRGDCGDCPHPTEARSDEGAGGGGGSGSPRVWGTPCLSTVPYGGICWPQRRESWAPDAPSTLGSSKGQQHPHCCNHPRGDPQTSPRPPRVGAHVVRHPRAAYSRQARGTGQWVFLHLPWHPVTITIQALAPGSWHGTLAGCHKLWGVANPGGPLSSGESKGVCSGQLYSVGTGLDKPSYGVR